MKQRDDNKNIKQTKIAVDFQAKFNRPITRQCISQVGNGEIVPVKLWQRANWSKFPRRYPKNPRFNERKAIIFLLFEKLIKYENFLFPSKNSESPEIFFFVAFSEGQKSVNKNRHRLYSYLWHYYSQYDIDNIKFSEHLKIGLKIIQQ